MIIQVKGYNEGINLSSKSFYRETYIELAKNGEVERTFSHKHQATSFRHNTMIRFKKFGTHTSLKRDGDNFIVNVILKQPKRTKQ